MTTRGLQLLTQPGKEPARALRHSRLVVAMTHDDEHPSRNRGHNRASPS